MSNFRRKVERSLMRKAVKVDIPGTFITRENVYTCQKCGGLTVTVDIDEGVTPFMIGCRASGNETDCNGDAYSAFYPKGPRPPHIPKPSWEWYKPSDKEVNSFPESWRDHYRKGGLHLRKISLESSQVA
ncbi:MAG TPA: hypothetical protein VMQ76_06965 [Terracidiphilus sp.]|jgi:hypothetical protein|nr:hypothetical protein [Terracidiphilus sp.]